MAPSPPTLSSVPPLQTHQPKPQIADRLGTLQQRYRQHQATMRGTTANIPLTVVEMNNKHSENERENEIKQQRARSNSMANSSFTSFPDQQLVCNGPSVVGMLQRNGTVIVGKIFTEGTSDSGSPFKEHKSKIIPQVCLFSFRNHMQQVLQVC
jgi:hypothetical protein